MINREVIYERNLTGSYMKIPASYDAAFDEKMMLRKKLPGLLPVEKCYVDGGGQYWYNISGRQSLDTFCRVKTLGIDFIERMIISICSEIEILEWNLLNADSLLLDPEFIFVTNSNQEIIFTIYPGAKESISKEFQQLMEFLLTRIDHKDAMAVRMAYAIYEKTLDEGYNIIDIRDSILQDKNVKVKEVETAKCPKAGGNVELPEDRKKKEFPEDRKKREFPEDRKKREIPEDRWNKAENVYQFMKGIWREWKEKIKQTQTDRFKEERKKIEVVYPEDVYQEEQRQQKAMAEKKSAVINPTICLSDYREHPEGLLLYEGLENLDNIRLHPGIEKIGQGDGVDIVISKNTISHFHAQMECRESEYYLEDLNSTNGTYVNDVALSYKEKRKLCCNDIVRFADVKYRFI